MTYGFWCLVVAGWAFWIFVGWYNIGFVFLRCLGLMVGLVVSDDFGLMLWVLWF